MGSMTCCGCGKEITEKRDMNALSGCYICADCYDIVVPFFPTRKKRFLGGNSKVDNVPRYKAAKQVTAANVKDWMAYIQENNETYASFTPTKVLFDGALELDEDKQLFRVMNIKQREYDDFELGKSTQLIFPYSAVKDYFFEMIYHTSYGDDNPSNWTYTDRNLIVIELNDKYVSREVFQLKKIEVGFFKSGKKVNIEAANDALKQLKDIFGKPVLKEMKLFS